ncbi:MAG: type II toxin-antitoxin system RelE/ParE family toxin [Rhodanobacteraceae bacterium]|nr:type II toxin-antitoxin system RelE/ParE family toxin [Xanthomonadales bacterium]MCP5474733.1 type II toxin-antitoxin system RelE/ParE family toxin [Rhodanobacteraceae bacterium]
MAAELIWTHEALDDVDAIAQFIARDSPHHARRVVEAMFELSDSIGEQPMIGRVVPELQKPKMRERFLYSYRVIYDIGSEQIAVVAVIHGRRLLESIAERFEP